MEGITDMCKVNIPVTEIPVFDELDFEEEKHRYSLDGKFIPSVSSIMKPLSQACYSGVDEEVLNRAAARGTAVHNAIENYSRFGIVDLDPLYEGYFRAFKNWWCEFNPKSLGNECRVYHKYLRYAGTADMPVRIGDDLILVDFKTSATVNKMLTGVQLEAYAKAYESHGLMFDGKAILHLKSDGKYSWHFYQKNDNESWEVFGALLTVYGHIQKYKWRKA